MKISQKKLSFILLAITLAFLSCPVFAKDYYVAAGGNDTNPGSIKAPFATIQKAADIMSPGDTCYIRGGVYRESVNLHKSGTSRHVIKFTSYKAEKVILDGTDILNVNWSVYRGNIYKAPADKKFEQLFVDGTMMVEARWPNIESPDGVFDRNTWAYVDDASLGKSTDSDLPASGIDWTGAYGVFNVSQQMENWVRKVTAQDGNSITYDTKGITNGLNARFDDDRYYLFGKLDALDIPGEWFLDTRSNIVYLWTKASDSPAKHSIAVKQRDYGFDAAPDTEYIELNGLHFFGCEFRFQQYCRYITVDDCHLLYPNYSRLIPTMYTGATPTNSIPQMAGHHLTLQNCTIEHSLMNGMYFLGSYVTAKNNLLHDINWNGSNTFSAMVFIGEDANSIYAEGKSLARDNTIYDTGNVGIKFRHKASTAEYNNIFHGGLSAKDTTLLYTAGNLPNLLVQYNWLHDNNSWYGQGLGFRLDGNPNKVQTEKTTIRGNVVWNCPSRGFVIKGFDHHIYNNTVLGVFNFMYDSHQKTEIYNNYAQTFTFTVGASQKGVGFFSNNSTTNPQLQNPLAYDFSPSANSPLIDAGISSRPGYQWAWLGKAPDIGAMEKGLIYRTPGYRPIRACDPQPQDKTTNLDSDNIKLTWTVPTYAPDTQNDKDQLSNKSASTAKNKKRAKNKTRPEGSAEPVILNYNIYLGTDLAAVSSAEKSSAEFKANQTQTSYVLKKLQANTTYYWRVDTLDAKKNLVRFGHIWSFTTAGGSTPIVRKFTPTDDTFVSQTDPNTAAGNLHNISLQNSKANKYGLIKFQVSNISGKVTSARLRLHTRWQDIKDTTVYIVAGQWNQDTLTPNNNKLTWGNLLDSKNDIKAYRWYEFDVTKCVTADGSYTFGLKTKDSGEVDDMYSKAYSKMMKQTGVSLQSVDNSKGWYSKEYNNGFFSPELIVTYSK